jgi:hypothetical protein
LNRNPYPPDFIEALLETAERAQSRDVRMLHILVRLRRLNEAKPNPENAQEMKALVPQICWIVHDADGWFHGPGAEY